MIRIYEPEDLMEAQCLKDMLQCHNIFCHITGVHLMGAVGELPVSGLLSLYTESEDSSLALELIKQYKNATPVKGSGGG